MLWERELFIRFGKNVGKNMHSQKKDLIYYISNLIVANIIFISFVKKNIFLATHIFLINQNNQKKGLNKSALIAQLVIAPAL